MKKKNKKRKLVNDQGLFTIDHEITNKVQKLIDENRVYRVEVRTFVGLCRTTFITRMQTAAWRREELRALKVFLSKEYEVKKVSYLSRHNLNVINRGKSRK